MSLKFLPFVICGLLVLWGPSSPSSAQGAGGQTNPFSSCEAEIEAEPMAWNRCGCLYRVGTQSDLTTEAVAIFLRLLETNPEDPCLLFNLGRLRMLDGDPKAEDLLRAAAAGYRERGWSEGEVYGHINLSRILRAQGRDEEAQQALGQARAVSQAAGNEVLEAQVALQDARLRLARGRDLEDLEIKLAELAEIVLAGDTLPSLQRDVLLALGNTRYQLGKYLPAEHTYHQMAELCGQAEDPYGRATALQNLAIAVLAQGPRQESTADRIESLLRTALDAAVAAGQHHAEADARVRLGKWIGGTEGQALLQQSVTLARQLGSDSVLARGLAALASHALSSDTDHAIRLAAESRQVALSSPHFGHSAAGWVDRLEVSWALQSRSDVMTEIEETLTRVEAWRDQQRQELGRTQVFAPWTEIYYALSGRFLKASQGPDTEALDIARAFAVTERMRARVLLESLVVSGIETPVSPLSSSENPQVALQNPAQDLSALQETLLDSEAVFSFQLADERDAYGDFAGGSWLLSLTKNDVRVYTLPDRLQLEPKIRAFLHLFPQRDDSERVAARRLYDDLLAGAVAGLPKGIDHLLIVPDGLLSRLPFAALRSADHEPLIKSYRLSTVPSAALLQHWRRMAGPLPPASSALIFADPLLDEDSSLAPLPFARREGRAAQQRMATASRMLTGRDASEQSVKTLDLQPFGVLHFAAHAIVDANQPEQSAIELSASSTEEKNTQEDGRLRPSEIATLNLHRKLVVLSTCDSAGGAVYAGEGTLSLARAFFKAGATAVVASRWPMRDKDSAAFFERFYDHLSRGQTVGDAFSAAQRQSLAEGEPAEMWAGMVLLGDGDLPFPAVERGLSFSTKIILGLSLVTLMGILLAVAVRSHSHSKLG